MSGMSKICAQCKHYLGCGDWDLCCAKGYQRLCYEDAPASDCPGFEQNPKCTNMSSFVGLFRCSKCGLAVREREVEDTCPGCGEVITGALLGTQKHWGESK